jgi:hypothetical protein
MAIMGERNKKYMVVLKAFLALPVLSFMLFFSGCLNFGPQPQSFTSPLDSRLIAGVPFYPDDSSHCGPSTLAAVLSYYGRPTTMQEVAVDVQRQDLRGSLGPDLVLWAREHGANATFDSLKPEQLIQQINKQKPVIVLLDSGLGVVQRGHFVVVVGYGPDGVVANSGLIQQQLISWSSFLTDWFRMGNFAILISGLEGAEQQEPEQSSEQSAMPYISPSPYPNIPIPVELQGADLPEPKHLRSEPIINVMATPPTPPPPKQDAAVLGPARDIHGNLILPVVPLPEEIESQSPESPMTEETLITTPPPPPIPLPPPPNVSKDTQNPSPEPQEAVPVMGWEREK